MDTLVVVDILLETDILAVESTVLAVDIPLEMDIPAVERLLATADIPTEDIPAVDTVPVQIVLAGVDIPLEMDIPAVDSLLATDIPAGVNTILEGTFGESLASLQEDNLEMEDILVQDKTLADTPLVVVEL